MHYTWTCSCCGQNFDTLPLHYAVTAPRNWFGLPEAERATRAMLSDDLCTIDNSEHYVRGCLEIPLLNSLERLVFGVWVSVSEESLRHILALWEAPVIARDEPPRFGWLSTWLNGYPEPVEVRCHIYMRAGNLRPLIKLEPTDYKLATEQYNGVTLERVQEIAASSGHR